MFRNQIDTVKAYFEALLYKIDYHFLSMDSRFILYSLFEALFTLWEIIKEILKFIFLPIKLFFMTSRYSADDFFPMAKRIIIFRLKRLKQYGFTLRFQYTDGKLTVLHQTHREAIKILERSLNEGTYPDALSYFRETLDKSKDHSLLIYKTDERSTNFFQFIFPYGVYLFDFPLTNKNLNQEYSSEVLTVLRNGGFTRVTDGFPQKYKTYSIVFLSDEMTTISADCGTDLILASALATYVYTKILKKKTRPKITLE